MYSYICGKIRAISPTSVLIDNQGIGYFIHISLQTYSIIKDNNEAQVYTHCVIKNENQSSSVFAIYGFATEQERSVFLNLISVSGVGNNTAQLILSSFEPTDLVQVIASGDAGTLQKVKGIGTKTAQRIVLELKDKMVKGAGDNQIPVSKGNTIREESLSALVTLGFNRLAADRAVDKSLKEHSQDATVEKIIKSALSYLSS
jgi:holliday junction DNA helicase RuvA